MTGGDGARAHRRRRERRLLRRPRGGAGGATATILEKAPPEAAGGNSFYTAGAFRVVHGGLDHGSAARRRDRTGDLMVVGLIGAGIGASLSPALHEREAALLGFDYAYRLYDLDELERPPSDVGALVREAARDGLSGLNVTHPCKQLVLPALDALSPEAAALGAVNTVVLRDGRMTGHNTDLSGFQEAFERRLPGAGTDRVVVLGAGGRAPRSRTRSSRSARAASPSSTPSASVPASWRTGCASTSKRMPPPRPTSTISPPCSRTPTG